MEKNELIDYIINDKFNVAAKAASHRELLRNLIDKLLSKKDTTVINKENEILLQYVYNTEDIQLCSGEKISYKQIFNVKIYEYKYVKKGHFPTKKYEIKCSSNVMNGEIVADINEYDYLKIKYDVNTYLNNQNAKSNSSLYDKILEFIKN